MKTQINYLFNTLESQVLIENQNWILKLNSDLKIFKIRKSLLISNTYEQIFKICEIRQDLTLSFCLVYENQKNIMSQKIGIQIEQNGQSLLKCYFSNQNEVQKWQYILKFYIPQTKFHQHFKALRVLGKGSQGTVYLTKCFEDNKLYAVKGICKQKLNQISNGKNALINEIKILRLLKNQNILKFYNMWESENTYYLQFSYEPGNSLLAIMQKMKRPMEKNNIKTILIDVLKGLQYLNSKRILHRDIKPQNIIVSSNKAIILDFRLATEADLDNYLFTKCGTPGFISPEIANLQFHQYIDPKCDIFSLGAIFHILLTGRSLFQSKNLKEMIIKNRQCNFDLDDFFYAQFDNEGMDLLKKMLAIDPEERTSAQQALKHPYLN